VASCAANLGQRYLRRVRDSGCVAASSSYRRRIMLLTTMAFCRWSREDERTNERTDASDATTTITDSDGGMKAPASGVSERSNTAVRQKTIKTLTTVGQLALRKSTPNHACCVERENMCQAALQSVPFPQS